MRWCDVFGPPGVGKSALCDAAWPPREIEGDDAFLPEWAEFIACADRLMDEVAGHPSAPACRSMLKRSFRKMAAVARREDDRVYVQTGFAQRGLGLGWRLQKPERVAEYYRLMPVSHGVAVLTADVATVQRRNVERGKDRSYMVPKIAPVQRIAIDVLRDRGVRMIEIDTTGPIGECRKQLAEFARC